MIESIARLAIQTLLKNNGFADYDDMVYNRDVERDSKAFLVLGLPASGKSSVISDKLLKDYKAFLLDSDEAKKILPEYDNGWGSDAVHKESKLVIKELRKIILASKMNFVHPIVGSKLQKVENLISELYGAGYDVTVHLVEVDAQTSLSRLLKRFISDNRFLNPRIIFDYGNKPSEVYDSVKEGADNYAKWSNEVKRGERPRKIEQSYRAFKQNLERGGRIRREADGKQLGENIGSSQEACMKVLREELIIMPSGQMRLKGEKDLEKLNKAIERSNRIWEEGEKLEEKLMENELEEVLALRKKLQEEGKI